MGGSYDALMLRQQQSPAPGRYSGTAVPHVNGPSPSSYTQPQNWTSPAVSGRDLIVRRDVLREVASDLAQMADELQTALSACATATGPVAPAAGSWHEAQQLAAAMTKAHTGVTQFTGELRQAHHDMATRLSVSADRYDAAEQQITSLIHAAADPSATIIGSGGQDTPVQPGYGQNWTPQQRAAYYRMQRLENMPGNGGPTWTGTYPITEDAGFSQGSSAGYTWQQVQSLLAATDPGAISAAGAAYGQLASTLTGVTSRLASHGQTLAGNWGGSTAVTAVSQVQQLYQTAADMQASTWAAQQALQWYGPVLSAFRGSLPTPASSHPADVTAANQAAQQRMAALNSHIETAYYQMPGAVNKNLPPPLAGTGGGPAGSGGAGAGGGGSGYSAGGHAGAGGPAPAFAGAAPAAGASPSTPHLPSNLPPAGSTQLAGLASSGPGVPSPAFPGPVAGGATAPTGAEAGGLGAVPPIPGGVPAAGFGNSGAVTPPADAAPGEFGSGVPRGAFRDPAALGEPGAAGEAGLTEEQVLGANGVTSDGLAATGEAGAAEAGRLPGTFPMTGAGAGGPGQSESGPGRQYWASEDEATWGPDVMPAGMAADGAAADGGVGWMMPGGTPAGRGQQRDRGRMAWLGEDDDFWGAGEPAVPPVIGG